MRFDELRVGQLIKRQYPSRPILALFVVVRVDRPIVVFHVMCSNNNDHMIGRLVEWQEHGGCFDELEVIA